MISSTKKFLESCMLLGITFILVNTSLQIFFQQGLATIFPLYMVDAFGFSEKTSTLIYHVFCMVGSFCPLLGGLLGDSKLGKYRTIVLLSLVCSAGVAVLLVASTPIVAFSHKKALVCLAVLAICVGSGCYPVTMPFGGDQFTSDSKEKLSLYFSLSYFSANVATLLAILVAPVLRHDFQCYGQDTCFPLVFAVLGLTSVASLVVFVAGRRFYVHVIHERSVIKDVFCCAGYAFSKKTWSEDKKKHWLDYAEDKHNQTLISDAKAAFSALWWLLPVPVFWALDDQLGSTWVFQAMHMDGSLGMFTIKPDQMQILDPLVTLALVPLFDMVVYPRLDKLDLLQKPLERLTLGGRLAAVSFILAGILQLKIQESIPRLPSEGNAQLRVFNGLDCDVRLDNAFSPSDGVIASLQALPILDIPQRGSSSHPVSFTTADDCFLGANYTFSGSVTLQERQASSLFLKIHGGRPGVCQVPGFDRIDKSRMENPKLRVLYNLVPFEDEITLTKGHYRKTFGLNGTAYSTSLDSVLQTGKFSVKVGNHSIPQEIELGPSGIYTLVVYSFYTAPIANLITVTTPNNVHMLWQVPQYIVLTVAEVLFYITGNQLAYTQAPESMKSFMSVAWTMTDAFGNIIVVICYTGQIFNNQASEFFFYSSLMILATFGFKYISSRYEYYDPNK